MATVKMTWSASIRQKQSPATSQAGAEARPLVSLVVPAFNEAAVVEKNLAILCHYMRSLEALYRWEILVIDDGSSDHTAARVESFAQSWPNVRLLQHERNYGLGCAFRTGFEHAQGDFIVTLDLDLSYSPDHIETMLLHLGESAADMVVASPYMKGGKVSNVPWSRRQLSAWANRFLRLTSSGRMSTLTGMVRAYRREFVESIPLRSQGMEVNPEMVYKGGLLGAHMEEVPAHLNWEAQRAVGRRSSMKVLRQVMAVLLAGFLFRPVLFFILPGLLLLSFGAYVNAWMLSHFWRNYQALEQYSWFFDRASLAVAAAYTQFPHTFIVGGLSLMLAIQLISLGILSLQSKSYFEEIFHLGSATHRHVRHLERSQQ
jgi:glycosyltransferase involved in cell wall biosynthesis